MSFEKLLRLINEMKCAVLRLHEIQNDKLT